MSNSDGPLSNAPWMVAQPLYSSSQGELYSGIPLETAMRLRYREVGLISDARSVLDYLPLGPLLRMDDGYVRFRAGEEQVFRYVFSDPSESLDSLMSVGMSDCISIGWTDHGVCTIGRCEWALGEVRRILDGGDQEISRMA